MSKRPWTDDEMATVRRNWIGGAPTLYIARDLGRSLASVEHRLRVMGLQTRDRIGGYQRRLWSPADVALLSRLWMNPNISAREIGAQLGLGHEAVKSKAAALGLPRRVPGSGKTMARDVDISPEQKAEDDSRLVAQLIELGGFPAYAERWVGRGEPNGSISFSKNWQLHRTETARAA